MASLEVRGLDVGGNVQLFIDSSCTLSAGASIPVTLETQSVDATLTGDGRYYFYAQQSDDAGNRSGCSTGTPDPYLFDAVAPEAPTHIQVATGTSVSGTDRTPTFVVSGLEEMSQVQLFDNARCSHSISDEIAHGTGTTEEVTLRELEDVDETYTIYARQRDESGRPFALLNSDHLLFVFCPGLCGIRQAPCWKLCDW